ncbi:oligoendopeptidase F [Deinobacterium chartae]|uniref:Oligoendopeptidase F n=1 Tax=Deinobacterium chartae TaxID=521158 RepID=A0A841I036_9DEIO|nr:M3 family oligoendopeptidase [Deinobacterium chartae]MBB6098314.1 oligoendopeptidase F [Deinobacterium chartae]
MNDRVPATRILTWADLEGRYAELEAQALSAASVSGWLHAWSELEKEVAESATALSLAADLDTADEAAQQALERFIAEVSPKVAVASQRLKDKLLALEGHSPAEEERMMLRRFRTDAALFREENVPLEAEHQRLMNEYGRITGGQVVRLGDEELTVPQVEQRLLDPSREVREAAWRALFASKLEVAPQLDELILKLLPLRRKLAENAGLGSYRDYIWQVYHRYDYTPQDCAAFHAAVEAEFVPLASEMLEAHRAGLGVESLRPWDFSWRAPLDPQNRPPLKPFETVEELEEVSQRVFARLDPELGRQFGEFRQGYLDLGSRPGKMSHAYCAAFPKRAMPYVLMNVVGSEGDVRVLLHETGHAFHGYASMRSQPLVWNQWSATEFVEVPSQAMELLALPYLGREQGGFYSEEELRRVRQTQIAQVVHILPWIMLMDAFQHWLYAEAPENVTIAELDAKWAELARRFMPQTDWSGLERELGKGWQYYHIFRAPFYYIEYGLSWLGALQVWKNSLTDREEALRRYRAALELGDSRSVPELFEAAGARFAFDRATVGALADLLREQLQA